MSVSSARLRRLGAELRRLREAAGITQVEAAAAIGRSHPSIVSWERGRTRLSKSDLTCLLTEYDAPPEIRRALEELRVEAGKGGTEWVVYDLPDWLRPLYSFEEDAVAVNTFQSTLVPGLLQTEEYARAVHLAGPYTTAPAYVDRWVEARMLRQRRLRNADPLRLHTVIGETALRIPVGGHELMGAQLEHLRTMAEHPTVTLQLMPLSAGAHAAMMADFSVLHFADPTTDPPLGYFDGPVGGQIISDSGDVASLVKTFASTAAQALDEAESARLLSAVLREHRHTL